MTPNDRPPGEVCVGEFTELPAVLFGVGQPDPLVVPLLHRPHVADPFGDAHLAPPEVSH